MQVRGEKLTVKRCLRYLKRLIYYHAELLIFERSIDSLNRKITSKMPVNVRASNMQENDIDALMKGRRQTYQGDIIERHRRGHLCFVAEYNKKIVGYAWSCPKELYLSEIDKKIEFDDKSVWIYDEFVDPEYRGKRIIQQIYRNILDYYKDKKFNIAYVGILAENVPSLNAHKVFGFDTLNMKIRFRKIFGVKKWEVE